jgi:uncharacterized membrane protein
MNELFMVLNEIVFSKKIQSSRFEEDKTSDKPARSISKALSWRFIGTLDTLIVSCILTGEIGLATSIASIDFITKLLLYFFHERIWNQIKWGK